MHNSIGFGLLMGALLIGCGDDDSVVDAGVDASVDGAPQDMAEVDADGDVEDSAAEDAAADSAPDAPAEAPAIAFRIDPSVVTETPASTVTFELEATGAIPEGGVRVYILGDVSQSLTQLDLFNVTVEPDGGDRPAGDLDFSGFTALLEAPIVRLTIPSFSDGEAEDPVDVNFRLVPFEEVPWGELPVDNVPAAGAYTVGSPSTATLRLQDEP